MDYQHSFSSNLSYAYVFGYLSTADGAKPVSSNTKQLVITNISAFSLEDNTQDVSREIKACSKRRIIDDGMDRPDRYSDVCLIFGMSAVDSPSKCSRSSPKPAHHPTLYSNGAKTSDEELALLLKLTHVAGAEGCRKNRENSSSIQQPLIAQLKPPGRA